MSKDVSIEKIKKGNIDIIKETTTIITVKEITLENLENNKITLQNAINETTKNIDGLNSQIADVDAKILLLTQE